MKHLYLFLFLLAYGMTAVRAAHRIDTVSAEMHVIQRNGITFFEPVLPPLTAVPGGREPFYTYLWDFGDGHFSLAEKPQHTYAQAGDYTASLYVVNNYDDGPRPKRRAKGVKVDSTRSIANAARPEEEHFFGANGIFQLSKNANALPGQDMVIIAGVKSVGKGRVFILTNEKAYEGEGLKYAGQSFYNQEKPIPDLDETYLKGMWANVSQITETYSGSPHYGMKIEKAFTSDQAVRYFSALHDQYKTITHYEIEDKAGAPQFSFINLDVTPEMLADTNAIVTVTGIYIPDKGEAVVHKLEVPVVTSHDPNKMSLKNARLSYRTLAKNKELIYKVQFQNDGEGDAKNVLLEMVLPPTVDPRTFKLLHLYPSCDTCATDADRGCWRLYQKGADTLVFHFKDISLPGTKAADITDPDSTKGFIRFSVQTQKKLENKPFKARTRIFFDKNDPIETNLATGRFKKGISPILFAGYGGFTAHPTPRSGQLKEWGQWGVGVAPIAPYQKLYWQLEAYVSPTKYEEAIYDIPERGDIPVQMVDDNGKIVETTVYYGRYHRILSARDLYTRVVPVHIRYNINSFLGVGIGALAEGRISLSNQEERIYIPFETMFDPVRVDYGSWEDPTAKWSAKAFADVTVGRVYFGPSLGLRYTHGGHRGNQWHLYAAWRL